MRILGVLLMLLVAFAASASHATGRPPDDFSGQCSSLIDTDLTASPEAPAKITSAAYALSTGAQGRECDVEGYIVPQIGFYLRLPEQWNGRFAYLGCGGWCGVTDKAACDDAVSRGFACVVSDMGHKGGDTLWAVSNMSAQVDFSFRATHAAAIVSKEIIGRLYGIRPRKSYFLGCSSGGRQGLIEAQRFPWDFDGIVAGAPPMDLALLTQTWLALAFNDTQGHPLFTRADIDFIHQAVLDLCDSADGLKDGIIANPLACRFRPSSLLCSASMRHRCLTSVKVEALDRIYRGPSAAGAAAVYSHLGAEMPGSELSWLGPYVPVSGGPYFSVGDINRIYQTIVWPYAIGPVDVRRIDFANAYKTIGFFQALETPNNPDLRAFKAAGGKLIMYQGWNDWLEVPRAAIDYYETVQKIIGSAPDTQSFFRLFMIPGMHHCGTGEGPWMTDYLAAIEQWAERGRGPDRLIMTQPPQNATGPAEPKDRSSPHVRTRPVYPYPEFAAYRGVGDPNDPAAYSPGKR